MLAPCAHSSWPPVSPMRSAASNLLVHHKTLTNCLATMCRPSAHSIRTFTAQHTGPGLQVGSLNTRGKYVALWVKCFPGCLSPPQTPSGSGGTKPLPRPPSSHTQDLAGLLLQGVKPCTSVFSHPSTPPDPRKA